MTSDFTPLRPSAHDASSSRLPSTPSKTKASGQSSNSSLFEERGSLLSDLKQVVTEVPIDWFFQSLMPPAPTLPGDDTVQIVVANLRETGVINSAGYWRHWGQYPLSKVPKPENALFEPIAVLAEDIRQSSGFESQSPSVVFRCNPYGTPRSIGRNSSSKPDSFAVLRVSDCLEMSALGHLSTQFMSPHWLDIAVPGEFKKRTVE